MDGIATMLNDENFAQVLSLWRDLQQNCELPEVRGYLPPHFSWHVAETYDQERLTSVMETCCKQLQPFKIRTSGLGIFSGERPIIYVSIIKNQQLLDVHDMLWESFTPLARNPSTYYSPDLWMPHITLFFDEIFHRFPSGWDNHRAMMCVLESLTRIRFEWEILVDNFAYGRMENNEMIFQHYPFNCQ